MFQPASLKGSSPTPLDEKLRKKYLVLYIFIIILSFVPVSIFEYTYYILFWQAPFYWIFFLMLPINFLIAFYLLEISSLIISSLLLLLINLIHIPKEGTFKRDIEDKDYLYWNLRNLIKKWSVDIVATNPFPWLKNRFALRFFGVRIGRGCICDNAFLSSEFLEIGDNVILGMSTFIFSFGIEAEKLILKKITIGKDVLIGAKCTILPGTTIQEGVKLSAHSYTDYEDVLEKNHIYKGHPAVKID